MSDISKKVKKIVGKIVNRFTNTLSQDENRMAGVAAGAREKFTGLLTEAGAEGIVLLRNDGTLPLKADKTVAYFGRCQFDWFYIGYGSGGDVIAPEKINLVKALAQIGVKVYEPLKKAYSDWLALPANEADHGYWGNWPYNFDEMPLTPELIEEASEAADTAVVVIGRAAGEDRENVLKEGSYYLTKEEVAMLDAVTSTFEHTVVLMNCGNMIDMSWTEKYGDKLSAIMYVWQLGERSGAAVADVLYGVRSPSGKLPMTVARNYSDYPSSSDFGNREFNNYSEDIYVGYRYFETFAPEKVLYPFGFGLSYTSFTIEPCGFEYKDGKISVKARVANTGKVAGKEVVQIYCRPPQGKLGKPLMNLVAFTKTAEISPDETEVCEFTFDEYAFASFDDGGLAGYASAYVLEKGEYEFYIGSSVRDVTKAGSFTLGECKSIVKLEKVMCVDRADAFDVLYPAACHDGGLRPAYRKVCVNERDLKKRISLNIFEARERSAERFDFSEVVAGRRTVEEFADTLSDRELESLTRGEGKMNSRYGVIGNAGAYGGVTEALRASGVPALITCDGPAGVRIRLTATLLPCGTAIAATWNTALVRALYKAEGREARAVGSDIMLGPGMNIHRNPLCGRNFEYFSEDPVLSGKTAAACVKGLQSGGASACPKHFACNNQEVNRNYNDSRVSERALREIYLKGFEICVRESAPDNIMTSYNKINGVWSHYNYDLAETVLRNEWGFDGVVITDWWMRRAESPEFEGVKDNAYRVRSGVDVLMPGNIRGVPFDHSAIRRLGKEGGITRYELLRTARRVLGLCARKEREKKYGGKGK